MNANIALLIEDNEEFLKNLPLHLSTCSPEMFMLVCRALKNNETVLMALVFYYLSHEHELTGASWEAQAAQAVEAATAAEQQRSVCE